MIWQASSDIFGDNVATAKTMAQTVGIKEIYANLLPEDKVAVIQRLQERCGKVAMVGQRIIKQNITLALISIVVLLVSNFWAELTLPLAGLAIKDLRFS